MTGRVLLTGISGFIGSHVALSLLNAGYTVRGSLRDMSRAADVAATLTRAGADTRRLEFATLDLSDDHGWYDAARNCRYLMHVASPLTAKLPKDRETMIRPAVDGTRRALEAALETGVERIVVTSSAAAVAYGHPRDRTTPLTDADWSNTEGEGVSAYTESKTRAELEAWSIMEEAGRRADLVAINPVVVLGPLLSDDPGTSPLLIQRLLAGALPLAPRLGLSLVDVRDVAALHITAMASPLAGGHRFLAAASPLSVIELSQTLRAAFPAFAPRLPGIEAPDWLVRLAGLFNAEVRDNTRGLGRAPRAFDTAPAEALLGRPFITARLAAAATAQSLIDFGLVRPPPGEKKG